MAISETNQPMKPARKRIPDYKEDYVTLAKGASAPAKFLFAVAVAELIKNQPNEDDKNLNTVVISASSGPLLWFELLFKKRPDAELLRDLGSILLQYVSLKGLTIRPIFTRIESLCSHSFSRNRRHDLLLRFEPAFAEWIRDPSNNRALESIIGWPSGLLNDILGAVWTRPEDTIWSSVYSSGERIDTFPIFVSGRPSYEVACRPSLCPLCGRDTIIPYEPTSWFDLKIGNAWDHALVMPGSDDIDDYDPNWVCSSCHLRLTSSSMAGPTAPVGELSEFMDAPGYWNRRDDWDEDD